MRLSTACAAAVLLFAAPSRAEEIRDTAKLLTDCIDRFRVENGFAPTDTLQQLRSDQAYYVYGRPYVLRTGGTATDICKSAVFDQLGNELDRSIRLRAAAEARATHATERANQAEDRLNQFVGPPYGINVPIVTPGLVWLRENPYVAPMLLVPVLSFLFGHLFSLTPWYREFREHCEAKKRMRRQRARIRSGRKTVRAYRKPWPKWAKKMLYVLGVLLFIIAGIAFS